MESSRRGSHPMTLASISALANIMTLVILSIGAIAALVQLRHLRNANVLASMLAVEARFAQPELQRALLYVQNELPHKLDDQTYRAVLTARGYIDPDTHPEMAACNWFNEMGTMIEGDFLDEEVFLDSYGRLVEYYWHLLGPAISLLRIERGSEQYAAFGRLAYRAARRRERGGGGGYPRGVPRLPLTDPWAEIDRPGGSLRGTTA